MNIEMKGEEYYFRGCASGHILISLSSISFSLYSPQLFNRKGINDDQSLPFYVDDFYFQFHICFGG